MYKSKLLRYPDYDLTWFWEEVDRFNAIANPQGVDEVKQIAIIKSELQEILDSNNEEEFMDGVIDALFTLAPLVEEDTFKIYYYNNTEVKRHNYGDLERDIKDYIREKFLQPFDHESMVDNLLDILICDGVYYEENCEKVLESNMSKFIPINQYLEKHYEEVVKAYPKHTVSKEIREYEGEKFVVFFNENGKVLKGHSYYFDPVLICE